MGTLTIYYNSTSTSRYTENRTSYPSIYYNPTTTARFTFSPTSTSKTIGCSGKVMRSNLVIGGKTIACSGKMMRSDVKATYTPASNKPSITNLSMGADDVVGTNIASSYAIFSGWNAQWETQPYYRMIINAYNSSLVRSIPSSAPSSVVRYQGASKIGNYGLFAGGQTIGGATVSTVYAYNTSLTMTNVADLVSGLFGLSGGFNSSYAVFFVGARSTAYNASLTKTAIAYSGQSFTYYSSGGTGIGDYAIFGELSSNASYNYMTTVYNTVYAYNKSLVRSQTVLSSARGGGQAGTNGTYAIFAGGWSYTDTSIVHNTVDAYNTSLSRSSATALRSAGITIVASNPGYILASEENSTTVDAYNASLSRSNATNLSSARYNYGGASIGNYAIFAGGNDNTSKIATADAYGYV